MLPEIVDHAQNGLVIKDTPNALASAIRHLVRNPDVLSSMSVNAAKKAREQFTLEAQATRVSEIYKKIVKLGRIGPSKSRPGS
jgi:glycosyltransferase involved in cell wall biosynthesis